MSAFVCGLDVHEESTYATTLDYDGRIARKESIEVIDLAPGLVVAMVLHGLWNSPLLDPILLLFDSLGGNLGFIIGPFLLASSYYGVLYKYVREDLRDEEMWGYCIGRAPKEQ